jgi:hypothetical protein
MKSHRLSFFLLIFLGTADVEASTLQQEAGFIAMEPVTFYFHYGSYDSRLELKSSNARIWYSFQTADRNPAEQPLFVFFNGGPGASTSSGLMSMCTSRYSLDNSIDGGGDRFIENQSSWTSLGNLLYIDPRQTGFSYSMLDNVEDGNARFREFNAQNFNAFFDGAEFVRVLLRFLARHPEIQDNPVVIVGESYGGIRATVMLHFLLNYDDYGNGTEMYQDRYLRDEVQDHLDAVFPSYRGQTVPAEVIVRQFGHQVLIQPALGGEYQTQVTQEIWARPGSVLYRIGEEEGMPYDPERYPYPFDFVEVAGRDPYAYPKPDGWLLSYFSNAGRLLRSTDQLSLITGTDVTLIRELYAASRSNAYRVFDPGYGDGWMTEEGPSLDVVLFLKPALVEAWQTLIEPGDIESVFGRLQPWDRYFMSSNREANWAFHFFNVAMVRGYEVRHRLPRFGRMFLKNVAHVKTFITNAAWDLVIYSEAIPPALARYTDILTSSQHEREQPENVNRPGQIQLEYRSDAFTDLPAAGARTIRFPIYAESCHAVSLTQPEDLIHDVALWLAGTGFEQR